VNGIVFLIKIKSLYRKEKDPLRIKVSPFIQVNKLCPGNFLLSFPDSWGAGYWLG
jgi:hypothetical protein